MKKFFARGTTVLSFIFSSALIVVALPWQANTWAHLYEVHSAGENFEGQVFGRLFDRIPRCVGEEDIHPSCEVDFTYLRVPAYGFFLALEESGIVFRSPHYEKDIPTGDCSKYFIRNFFRRITALGERNVSVISGPNTVEVYAKNHVFRVTPGSEFLAFIEELPSEISSLESRIAKGCTEW